LLLSPNPPGTNITLQLSCLDGSGSAVFVPDGKTSTNITQSATVKIKGVTAGIYGGIFQNSADSSCQSP